MKSERSENLLNEIDETIKNIESFKIGDRLESYLAKFLVVFISGTYEEIIEDTVTLWVQSTSDKRIAKYFSEHIDEKFRNPSIENIIEMLNKFDDAWGTEIKKFSKQERASLDSIVTHRNDVAHGKSSSVTLSDVKKWHESAKKVIEKIDEIITSDCAPNRAQSE